jgi:hypothetical protein
VLAYFEYLDLPLEEFLVLEVELSFLDDLDGDVLLGAFVDAALDDAVLALAEGLAELVEVEDVGVADGLFDGVHPAVLVGFCAEVVDALLVGEYEHEGVEDALALDGLLDLVLDVDADQTLHVLVLAVALVLVRVELLAQQDEPVLLEDAALLLLLQDFPLDVDRVLPLAGRTRVFLGRVARQSAGAVLRLGLLLKGRHSLQGRSHSLLHARWRRRVLRRTDTEFLQSVHRRLKN